MNEQKNAGNADRITRAYLDSLLVEMRHIDAVLPSTRFKLYGEEFDTPVMMAALSHLNKVRENGMAEMAKGAYQANAVNWAGMGEMDELDQITATGARTIKIIKPYADNNIIFERIEHAVKAGVLAVGMDIDHAYNGSGEYDNVLGYAMSGKSLTEIKEFAAFAKVPFIIKGILSEQDTYKCLEAGVRGIVVSHHHGIMDYAVPPLMILPKIVRITEGKIPVFVDCGMESGMDVYKALALGADAVSVGRAIMKPLGENGAAGVRDKINEITQELAGVMARTCCERLEKIEKNVIWNA